MKRVQTVCITLEPEYVQSLEELRRLFGTKSEAVRRLLEMYREREAERELERTYRAYFESPGSADREREVTNEMLSIARWPEEGTKRGRKKRSAR